MSRGRRSSPIFFGDLPGTLSPVPGPTGSRTWGISASRPAIDPTEASRGTGLPSGAVSLAIIITCTIEETGVQAEKRLSSRAAGFTESVIREMTRKANAAGAINLAQGFPDFEAPDALKEAACRAIRDDHNQYAITWGSQRLREAIPSKVARYNGMDFDPETEVTVGCGSTEAMIASMLALVDPGDEVVVVEPFYENYGPDSAIAGAAPVFVRAGAGFAIDEDALGAAFGPKTRAIVLNTPNNPTGRVYSPAELRAIADLCIDCDAYAFVDEIYEHILYDGHLHL